MAAAFRELGGRYLGNEQTSPGSRILRYYKEIADAVKYFEERFSAEYLGKVKRKRLYWDTIDLVMPPPLYRDGFSEVENADLFRRLRSYPVRTTTKDFFLRFHTEVLPVKCWESAKGFFLPWGENCALCPTQETLQHVFLECTNAQLFWAELRSVLHIDMYPSWYTMKFLNYGNLRQSACRSVLTLIGLHAIWNSRTDHVLARVGGKPAWTYFLQGFKYVSSIINDIGFEELEEWAELELLLGHA